VGSCCNGDHEVQAELLGGQVCHPTADERVAWLHVHHLEELGKGQVVPWVREFGDDRLLSRGLLLPCRPRGALTVTTTLGRTTSSTTTTTTRGVPLSRGALCSQEQVRWYTRSPRCIHRSLKDLLGGLRGLDGSTVAGIHDYVTGGRISEARGAEAQEIPHRQLLLKLSRGEALVCPQVVDRRGQAGVVVPELSHRAPAQGHTRSTWAGVVGVDHEARAVEASTVMWLPTGIATPWGTVTAPPVPRSYTSLRHVVCLLTHRGRGRRGRGRRRFGGRTARYISRVLDDADLRHHELLTAIRF